MSMRRRIQKLEEAGGSAGGSGAPCGVVIIYDLETVNDLETGPPPMLDGFVPDGYQGVVIFLPENGRGTYKQTAIRGA